MRTRKVFQAVAFAALLAGCNATGFQSSPPHLPAATVNAARLLFEDNFNGSKLDTKKWFWCYPNGSPDDCTNNQHGIRYREEEQYRPTQLIVGDGALHLVAVRHSVEPHFPWTSGMVTTGGPFENGPPHPTFAFKYGYAEMRAKLPTGAGFWPAFWLLPANGDWPPEVDVMEWQGAQPRRDYMTYHFSTPTQQNDSIQGIFHGPNFSQGFHVYAIDWEPSSLTWYVDGVARFHVTAKQVEAQGGALPHTPMYVLMNLALGGWVSPPNKHTPSPAAMTIDYVRIWDRRP